MILFIQGGWHSLAFRALVAIAFGVATLVWPGITLLALVLLFGAFVFLDGITNLVAAFRARDEGAGVDTGRGNRLPLVLQAVLSIGIGVVTFVWPDITALALVFLIAAWALLTGTLHIAAAIRLRKEIDNEWLLILGGVLSVLFGVGVMLAPGAGALALVWVIGIYSVILGVTFVALAFRLKKHTHP
jgi:uncharacterized membrane protein HdeD (DUF308 family)